MSTPRSTIVVAALLVSGALARLGVILLLDPQLWVVGSDTTTYVRQGWLLAHGVEPLFLTLAPAYTWLVALVWACCPAAGLPLEDGVLPVTLLTGIRLVQLVFSLGTAWCAWRLARHWSGSVRAAALTCLGLALGPAFVVEPFRVLTETTFLFLLYLGLLLWTLRSADRPRREAVVGLLFGLAALVRPVVIGLPLVLGAATWFVARDPQRRARVAVFLLGFAAVLAPWSVSLRLNTGSWTPPGLAANLWIGSVGDGRWHGRDAADARRGRFAGDPDDYVGETLTAIRTAPGRWIAIRASNFAAALVQPHLASDLPGPSVRAELVSCWRGERPPAALVALATTPSAQLKLLLYALHWFAVVGGVAGLLRWRRQWRDLLPLWAVVVYFPAVHLALTALPRYLFPIQPALWVAVVLLLSPPPTRGSRAAAPGAREGR